MPENKLIDIVLDATMLDTYVVCPAKFNYRFNHNKSTIKKSEALDKGGVVHVGNEAYYKAIKDKFSYEVAVKSAIDAVNLCHAEGETDLEPDQISRIKDVLQEYFDYWKVRDFNLSIQEVESSFAYVLHKDEIIRLIMIGKIDLLVNEDSYVNLPYDHKTYSRDFPVYRKTNQFCNYAYATGSNFLMVNRVGLQTSLKPRDKFKRVMLSYDPLFLEQWKQNTIKWAYAYLDSAANNSWPLNDTSCDKYNRLCEYYEICDSSGQEAKNYKLNVNFKDTPKWDVSKALGTGSKE